MHVCHSDVGGTSDCTQNDKADRGDTTLEMTQWEGVSSCPRNRWCGSRTNCSLFIHLNGRTGRRGSNTSMCKWEETTWLTLVIELNQHWKNCMLILFTEALRRHPPPHLLVDRQDEAIR